MPAVFVHGNPECSAIWELLISQLERTDVVTLSPPGFGAPTPEDWDATRLDYLDWLCEELEKIGEPVDLVGHDWGGCHVAGVALTRPDLLKSWCIDLGGLFHPDYVWHDMAQVWQTEGAGEEAVKAMLGGTQDERITLFKSMVDGMTDSIANQMVEAATDEMGRCILALYRDAAQPAIAELGADLSVMQERPGLIIIAEEDHYVGTEAMARHTADRASARVNFLPKVGHWWMIQSPSAGAKVLTDFWNSN